MHEYLRETLIMSGSEQCFSTAFASGLRFDIGRRVVTKHFYKCLLYKIKHECPKSRLRKTVDVLEDFHFLTAQNTLWSCLFSCVYCGLCFL